MNTAKNAVSNLKLMTCAVAALAVTALLSWSFVDSTSVARWADARHATPVAGDTTRNIGFDIPRAGV